MVNHNKGVAQEIFDEEDILQNRTMAGLAYILFFLPLIMCKDSKFARFHANQGLVLLIIYIVGLLLITILSTVMAVISWRLYGIASLLMGIYSLLLLALAIYGLVNGLNGYTRMLPVIGKIKILK